MLHTFLAALGILGIVAGCLVLLFVVFVATLALLGWREARQDRRRRPVPVTAVEPVSCATEDLPPLPAWWSTSDVVSGAQRAYAEGATR